MVSRGDVKSSMKSTATKILQYLGGRTSLPCLIYEAQAV